MDSVVLVPVAMLAEPVMTPVDSSRNAHPKKLVLTGEWIEAGSAGAASLGTGGVSRDAMLTWSLADGGSSRPVVCLCAPRAASFPRTAGTSSMVSSTAAQRETTRATRRRIGDSLQLFGGLWLFRGKRGADATLPNDREPAPKSRCDVIDRSMGISRGHRRDRPIARGQLPDEVASSGPQALRLAGGLQPQAGALDADDPAG